MHVCLYSLPNLGECTKWCSSTEGIHVCSMIQYKYKHRWKSTGDKAYGVTSIQNRRKHLNNKYDVSKLIMSVLYNDTTVVTAEQGGGTNIELKQQILCISTIPLGEGLEDKAKVPLDAVLQARSAQCKARNQELICYVTIMPPPRFFICTNIYSWASLIETCGQRQRPGIRS